MCSRARSSGVAPNFATRNLNSAATLRVTRPKLVMQHRGIDEERPTATRDDRDHHADDPTTANTRQGRSSGRPAPLNRATLVDRLAWLVIVTTRSRMIRPPGAITLITVYVPPSSGGGGASGGGRGNVYTISCRRVTPTRTRCTPP
jgi:hypothetical protein